MEIHHADKAYRKRALWLLVGITIMCGALLWQLQVWLSQLTATGAAIRTLCALGSPAALRAGVALAIPAVGLGLTL
jgi:hypothetical protein